MKTRRLVSIVAIALLLVPYTAPVKVSAEVSTGVSAVADVVATDIPSQNAEDFLSPELAPSQDEQVAEPIPTEELNPTELPVPADESTELKVDPDEPSPLVEGEGGPIEMSPKPQRLQGTPQQSGAFNADLFSGNATYRYGFNLPEGRGGLTPMLVLSYSSGNRNEFSIYGSRGWAMEPGHIERSSRFGSEKLYTASASFQLHLPGGQGSVELVPVSLDGDGIHGTYGAKVESDFALITFATSNVWTIVDRQGTTWRYGTSTASRESDPSDLSRTSSWYIADGLGATGATLRYSYSNSDGSVAVLTNIVYGGQVVGEAEEVGPFRVSLTYAATTDGLVSFETGYQRSVFSRLSAVDVYVAGALRQRYEVDVNAIGSNGVGSAVSAIREIGYSSTGTASQLPPTTFSYQSISPTSWWSAISTTTGPVPELFYYCNVSDFGDTCTRKPIYAADMNGDGRDDLVRSDESGRVNGDQFTLAWPWVYLLQQDNTWLASPEWRTSVPALTVQEGVPSENLHTYVDVNGDRRADVIMQHAHLGGGRVYLNNGHGFQLAPYITPINFGPNSMADINGDGLVDFFTSKATTTEAPPSNVQYMNGEWIEVYLNTGNGWVPNASWTIPFALDVCLVDIHGYCYLNPGQDEGSKYRAMEVNGDGLVDFVMSWSNDGVNKRAVFLNNGHGWAEVTASQWGTFPNWYNCQGWFTCYANSQNTYETYSYNGDAVDDVVHRGLTADLRAGVPGGTYQTVSTALPELDISSLPERSDVSKYRSADFNGDGLPDSAWGSDNNAPSHYRPYYPYRPEYRLYLSQMQPDYLLTGIVEPTGAATTIEYREAHRYYGDNGKPLNENLPFAIWTPQVVTVNPGNGQPSQVTTYEYCGGGLAYASSTDREFAGFWKVSATSGDTKIYTEFHQGLDAAPLASVNHHLRFGPQQYAEVIDGDDAFDLVGDFTLEARVRSTSTPPANNLATIISKEGNYQLTINEQNELRFLYSGGTRLVSGGLADGLWHTYSVTYATATGALKFYRDGQQQGETQTIGGSLSANSDPLRFGGNGINSVYYDFTGDIEEVRVWGVERAASEISGSYEGELLGTEPGLLGYWRMTEGFGSVTADDVADHDASFGSGSASPVWVPGPDTRIYHFNQSMIHPDRGQYSDEPAKRGRVYRTEVRDASSDDLLSAQVTKWESATLDGPNRKFVYPSRTTSFVAKASGLDATAVERTFDTATGNELSTFSRGSVTADSGTGDISGELGTDQSTEDKQYATSSGSRILGAPKVAKVKDENDTVIAEKEIRYDGLPLGQVSQGKPTRVEDKMPSSAVYATYDSYANVASSSDPRGATTTFSYDATYHLAPTRSVNPLGQATFQELDLATRQVVSTTDANGANERWIRDGFGRPLERWIQNPTTTGVVLAERWAYGDADRPVWVRHEAFDSVGDATPATDYTYADGAGRVIQTRAQEDVSTFIVGDTLYDSQGRVARQSLPYRGSGSSYATPSSTVPSTTYAYDAAGRVTTVFAPAGNTSIAYDGLVTRVTDALGRVAEQERDGQGRLIRVTRWLNSQPVTYVYGWDAAGRLTGMQDPGGNTREFTYDGQGRLLMQTDWHATSSNPDIWAYAYDAAGNVTSSTDPRGATIHYTYDSLNRVLTANDPATAGTDTTYSYDDAGSRSIGRLHEAIHRGVRSTYDYDRLGRTVTVDRNILGERLVQDYDYDLVGRELERDEPNGYKVWATYDRLGRWATTTATVGTTTATVASALSYTPLGQLESVLYGNGLVTRDTYTPADGYRLARRTTGEEGSYLQDLNYGYDAVGNVTHLVDASQAEPLGSDRTFAYDDLDRLVGVQGTYSGGENLDASSTFSYDALGNMKIRGDYGLYRLMYNGHPYRPSHAVVGGDGLVPFSWDAAGSLVEVGANLYQYDGFGRLATATYSNDDTFLDTFAYGHSGSRAYRSHDTLGDELDPAATYSLGTYEQDSDGAARLFIDAPGRRLAQVTVDPQGAPTVQYLHQDALGSSPLATAPSGDPAALADQDPYGLPRFTKLPDGGSAPARSYTGKELDPSSWYYFGARYYDPTSARFTQVDPVTLNLTRPGLEQLTGGVGMRQLLADPHHTLNPYAYAANNPVKYSDPDGNFIPLLIMGAYLAWQAYDTYATARDVHTAFTDPNATGLDKGMAIAFATLTFSPVDDVADALKYGGKALRAGERALARHALKDYSLSPNWRKHIMEGWVGKDGSIVGEHVWNRAVLTEAKQGTITMMGNGVRVHRWAENGKSFVKSYFPDHWTEADIADAGNYLLREGRVDGRRVFGEFKGVRLEGQISEKSRTINSWYPEVGRR